MDILDNYIEQLNNINSQYLKLCDMLTYEEIVLDPKLCQKLEREKNQIEPIALKFQEYSKTSNELEEFTNLCNNASQTDKNLIEEEITSLRTKLNKLSKDLASAIREQDATYDRLTILIQHSSDTLSKNLQQDIVSGYTQFCQSKNWQYTCKEYKNTIELQINGTSAKVYFKNEIGLHKAVNSTSSSTCIVYVLETPQEELVSFEDKDIQIQTCRSSGAGGQHINTTDSAIKITHLKSGISTTCQSERSQFQNKEKALEQLKEKVLTFYNNKYTDFIDSQRTKQYKSLNLKSETKLYNYTNNTIVSKSKTISLDTFLNGEEL